MSFVTLRYVPSSVERRSSTSARGLMLSRLSDAAADGGDDRPMSLATAAAGWNGPLWSTSTLLHRSERDVDASDAVRLRVDGGDEQHPPRSPASELPSDAETDELLSLSIWRLPLLSRSQLDDGTAHQTTEHEMAL